MSKSYFPCADCGTHVLVIGRNRSDADRLAAWHKAEEHVCDDCRAKRLAIENAEAADANAASGLPALIGSEKQVAWAETIRAKMLPRIKEFRDLIPQRRRNLPDPTESAARADAYQAIKRNLDLAEIGLDLLLGKTSAAWWIDQRATAIEEILRGMKREIEAVEAARMTAPTTTAEVEIAAAAEAEALLLPAKTPETQTVADIRLVAGGTVQITFPEKLERFREIVKGFGFQWAQSCWQRILSFKAGDPIDRLAEIAHHLVAAGYLVRLQNEAARTKAIEGSFAPEQRRWITKGTGKFDGWACITWARTDDFYDVARSLPGSRYSSGAVYVPPGAIEAVAEFAERYGFAMSESPRKLLEAHRAALANGAVIADLKTAPAPLRAEYTSTPTPLAPEAGEIDPSLREDRDGH